MSSTQEASLFVKLPAELRDMIYQEAAKNEKTIGLHIQVTSGSKPKPLAHSIDGLSSTCSQIRWEYSATLERLAKKLAVKDSLSRYTLKNTHSLRVVEVQGPESKSVQDNFALTAILYWDLLAKKKLVTTFTFGDDSSLNQRYPLSSLPRNKVFWLTSEERPQVASGLTEMAGRVSKADWVTAPALLLMWERYCRGYLVLVGWKDAMGIEEDLDD